MATITSLHAREILDSRGTPTIEVEVAIENGNENGNGGNSFGVGGGKNGNGNTHAVACVPSGASTGIHEAVELRDGDPKRYFGKGVLRAVQHVNDEIFSAVRGKDFPDQRALDTFLISLDGTPNKSRLGANAILGVSIAFAKACAMRAGVELYEYFGRIGNNKTFGLPVPIMNVINGGKHADSGLDIQEFMLVPSGFSTFSEKLRAGAEIFHTLKNILSKQGMVTSVGDEGGFAPHLGSNEEAFELLLKAISESGYTSAQVQLAVDVAASSFYEDGGYMCRIGGVKDKKTMEDLIAWYGTLIAKYPLVSIEDPLFEDDWDGFTKMTAQYGDKVTIVGDDLFVTNVERIKMGIEKKSANSVLIKMNQIGTISETIDAIALTQSVGWKPIVSHRSGETEDTTLADLCVGMNCPTIKTGSLCRSERIAKYNRLLTIEELQ